MAAKESAAQRVARLKAAIAKVERDLETALQLEQQASGVSGADGAAIPEADIETDGGWDAGSTSSQPSLELRSALGRGSSTMSSSSKRRMRPRPGSRGTRKATRRAPDTRRLQSLRKKIGAVEHKLDRAATLSRELERNDGYQPLLSLNSTGRPLKTADESILTDGDEFVETIKRTTHSIKFQDPDEHPPAEPLYAPPSAGVTIINNLSTQMSMVEGAMNARRPDYGQYTEDKDTWKALQKAVKDPSMSRASKAFRPTHNGPRIATAPRIAGGPRPCLTEPIPAAPPLMVGQTTSLGVMADSTKRSAMAPAFGTLTRDDRKHVYLSEEACRSQPRAQEGPAPGVYELPSSLLEQPQSTKRSAPTPKFTTLTRPNTRSLHAETGGRAHVTPLGKNVPHSPSVFFYTTVERDDPLLGASLSSLGRAAWRKAAPAYSIGGTTQRSKVVPRHTYTSPGPVYKLPSSFGKAPTAAVLRKSTTPKPKRWYGQQYFRARSSMGKQSLSRSRSSPSFGFSRSSRTTILK